MNKRHPDIKVPINYLEFCKEKVIVMEFVEGVPIMDVK
jgi:predicted unusual protein kinase regulating ubiquinone biosynthesis (AarF/ABC1/UbiB family)